jgi:hypothetical protein
MDRPRQKWPFIVAKAALSAGASIVGAGPAAALFELLKVAAAKRQAGLLADIAERPKKLEAEERLTLEDVVQSGAFVTATIRAWR